MDKFLTFTILGLSTAAIYAVAASGLVVTYTTSGIFNFAHGAFSMLAAFTYWQVHVEWGVPAIWSFLIVVFLAAPVFGAGIERVISTLTASSASAPTASIGCKTFCGRRTNCSAPAVRISSCSHSSTAAAKSRLSLAGCSGRMRAQLALL